MVAKRKAPITETTGVPASQTPDLAGELEQARKYIHELENLPTRKKDTRRAGNAIISGHQDDEYRRYALMFGDMRLADRDRATLLLQTTRQMDEIDDLKQDLSLARSEAEAARVHASNLARKLAEGREQTHPSHSLPTFLPGDSHVDPTTPGDNGDMERYDQGNGPSGDGQQSWMGRALRAESRTAQLETDLRREQESHAESVRQLQTSHGNITTSWSTARGEMAGEIATLRRDLQTAVSHIADLTAQAEQREAEAGTTEQVESLTIRLALAEADLKASTFLAEARLKREQDWKARTEHLAHQLKKAHGQIAELEAQASRPLPAAFPPASRELPACDLPATCPPPALTSYPAGMEIIKTIGYRQQDGLEEISRLMAEDDLLILVDIRYQPKARRHEWTGQSFRQQYQDRYLWVQALGNEHYKTPGDIKISDPAAGIALAHNLLAQGKHLLLLCGCAEFDACHRKTVLEILQTSLATPALLARICELEQEKATAVAEAERVVREHSKTQTFAALAGFEQAQRDRDEALAALTIAQRIAVEEMELRAKLSDENTRLLTCESDLEEAREQIGRLTHELASAETSANCPSCIIKDQEIAQLRQSHASELDNERQTRRVVHQTGEEYRMDLEFRERMDKVSKEIFSGNQKASVLAAIHQIERRAARPGELIEIKTEDLQAMAGGAATSTICSHLRRADKLGVIQYRTEKIKNKKGEVEAVKVSIGSTGITYNPEEYELPSADLARKHGGIPTECPHCQGTRIRKRVIVECLDCNKVIYITGDGTGLGLLSEPDDPEAQFAPLDELAAAEEAQRIVQEAAALEAQRIAAAPEPEEEPDPDIKAARELLEKMITLHCTLRYDESGSMLIGVPNDWPEKSFETLRSRLLKLAREVRALADEYWQLLPPGAVPAILNIPGKDEAESELRVNAAAWWLIEQKNQGCWVPEHICAYWREWCSRDYRPLKSRPADPAPVPQPPAPKSTKPAQSAPAPQPVQKRPPDLQQSSFIDARPPDEYTR